MISSKFVQKYLDVKELFEREAITEAKYTALVLELCSEYDINPEELAEYNMYVNPKKIIMYGKKSR